MKIDIVAEIGINHNGDIDTALKMIEVAAAAGCDYVKFQKRNPDICVPDSQKRQRKETPWGEMSYLEYKFKMEFGEEEFDRIDSRAKFLGIGWFASVWDLPSLEFMLDYAPPYIKIPSAQADNVALISAASEAMNYPVILSTGMCDNTMVDQAHCSLVSSVPVIVMHSVSCYPLEDSDANLSAITTLKNLYKNVGYSDHTRGIHMPTAAAAMGAMIIEKHITLDRTMWGTDQAASLEPQGLETMVRNIRAVSEGMGSGKIEVAECEREAYQRLRGIS